MGERQCAKCGARLDPGERCDCREEKVNPKTGDLSDKAAQAVGEKLLVLAEEYYEDHIRAVERADRILKAFGEDEDAIQVYLKETQEPILKLCTLAELARKAGVLNTGEFFALVEKRVRSRKGQSNV